MSNTQYKTWTTTKRCGPRTTGAATGTLHLMQEQQQQQQQQWSTSDHSTTGLQFGAIESRSRESLEVDWQVLKGQGGGNTPSRDTPSTLPGVSETRRQPWNKRNERSNMTSRKGIPTDASPQDNSSDRMRESECVKRRAGKQRAKTSENSSNERSNRPPSYNKRGNKCYTQHYPSSLPLRCQDWAGRGNYCPPNPRTNHPEEDNK